MSERSSTDLEETADEVPIKDLPPSQQIKYVQKILACSSSLIISLLTPVLANMVNLYWLRKYAYEDTIGGYGLGVVWSSTWVIAFIISINQALNVLVSHAFGS